MESSASRRRRGLVLLSDAELETTYTVSGIYERDRGLLEFLEHRGVRPGAKLRLLERNYDQTLTLDDSGRHGLARPRRLRTSLALPDVAPEPSTKGQTVSLSVGEAACSRSTDAA